MYKWKLMITTLPVPVTVVIIRVILEYSFKISGGNYTGVMDFSAISPVLTGGVFLIGLMLSGTLQDYKESEKIPAELACSLETMEETVTWVSANRPAVSEKALKEVVAGVTDEIIAWLLRQRTHEQGFAAIEKLNAVVKEFDKLNAGLPAARFMAEIHNLRKTVTRIGVISRTGFLASGYALLDILVVSVIALLLLASYKAEFGIVGKFIIISFVTLIYSYLWRLVRDVDDPFEYSPDGQRTGAAEVELFPLLEYQQRARARLRALGGESGADAAEGKETPAAAERAPASRVGKRLRIVLSLGLLMMLLTGGTLSVVLRERLAQRQPVRWSIKSTPAGATVLAEDGRLLGQTPLVLTQPRRPGVQKLTVRLDGFQDGALSCEGSADCQRETTLVAVPKAPVEPAKAAPAAEAADSKDASTAKGAKDPGGAGEKPAADEPSVPEKKKRRHHRHHAAEDDEG